MYQAIVSVLFTREEVKWAVGVTQRDIVQICIWARGSVNKQIGLLHGMQGRRKHCWDTYITKKNTARKYVTDIKMRQAQFNGFTNELQLKIKANFGYLHVYHSGAGISIQH